MTGWCLGFQVVFELEDPPSCESMAPTPYADASVSRKNGFVKSGRRSTGLSIIALQSVSNAVCSSVCHDQGVIRCVSCSSGRAIFE
jgi:hypothetical protein